MPPTAWPPLPPRSPPPSSWSARAVTGPSAPQSWDRSRYGWLRARRCRSSSSPRQSAPSPTRRAGQRRPRCMFPLDIGTGPHRDARRRVPTAVSVRRVRRPPSLFWRIFLIDAAVLGVAAGVLAFGPLTISSPILLGELAVLVAGL